MSVSGSTARLRLVKYEGNMRLCTQQMNGSKLNRWLQNDISFGFSLSYNFYVVDFLVKGNNNKSMICQLFDISCAAKRGWENWEEFLSLRKETFVRGLSLLPLPSCLEDHQPRHPWTSDIKLYVPLYFWLFLSLGISWECDTFQRIWKNCIPEIKLLSFIYMTRYCIHLNATLVVKLWGISLTRIKHNFGHPCLVFLPLRLFVALNWCWISQNIT